MNINQCLAVILLFVCGFCHGQTRLDAKTTRRILNYFDSQRSTQIRSDNEMRVLSTSVNRQRRTLRITLNEVLAEQPLTAADVQRMQQEVKHHLPSSYNKYDIRILCGTQPLEELVQFSPADRERLADRLWNGIRSKANPWVNRRDNPFEPTRGLHQAHVSLWASHGRYYDRKKSLWRWQRPRLFCTTEDLLTQSFVVPYLMPMLENAGAIVYSPRERDWQKHEVVIDNDFPQRGGLYREIHGRHEWTTTGTGFGWNGDVLFDGENPFETGSISMTDAQTDKQMASSVVWQPTIPEEGDYAVYVSYVTLPTSVPDATYTVRHSGVSTIVKVNQQMGSRTWVYLGTYHFQAGNSPDNCVTLSNISNYRGSVTADAVRFGGGMGNVARGDEQTPATRSMLPRYLEGSRYAVQYAGAPYRVYASKEGENDYAEDINARTLMANYLAEGSTYLPGDSGLSVPLEMMLAVHSDAGLREDSSIIGTLGIYTTGKYTKGKYEGLLAQGVLPSGVSRNTARDMCDQVMGSVCRDLQAVHPQWTRRQMYDRNYSETRNPEIPGMILETLSHQNWADLKLGHDPAFKFLLARAIYKGVLRYRASMHGEPSPVVQPLPVNSFSALLCAGGDSVRLSWQPTPDALEPTATADAYVLYTATGDRDWDNGTRLTGNVVTLPTQRGTLMRFRVHAANQGGISMPSEELCAHAPAQGQGHSILIVNGFTRLAGPQPIDNDTARGFRMEIDPGVVHRASPCYCGKQLIFNKTDKNTLGESGDEYESLLVAGNTFAYPTLHARDMLASDARLAISSSSARAFEQQAPLMQASRIVDYILGAQRNDGYSLTPANAFPTPIALALAAHVGRGGSLLVSGAYISEELAGQADFAQGVLHLQPCGTTSIADSLNTLTGMGAHITLHNDLNEQTFSTTRCSVLQPASNAFCSTLYANGLPASVAWDGGTQRTLTYGFPLEMITDKALRRAILAASLNFLIQ